MTTVAVRPAEPTDAWVLCALMDAVAAEGQALITPVGHHNPATTAAALMRPADGAQTWVAVNGDGGIMGVLECLQGPVPATRHTATFGMAVHIEARQQGVGRALVRAAEAWAQARGVHKMSIVCAASNTAGLAFYARCGYHVEGRQARQYCLKGTWVDAVWLAHWLEPISAEAHAGEAMV